MKCVVTALATVFLMAMPSQSPSQDLASSAEALKLIREFADGLCQTVPIETSSDRLELSGSAKAELEGIIKRLANLGIEGAANYKSASSQNVLQKDLAEVLKESRNCRLQVWNDLKGKFQLGTGASPRSEKESPRAPTTQTSQLLTKRGLISTTRTDVAKTEMQCVTAPDGWAIDPSSVEIAPTNPGGPRPWGYKQERTSRDEACFTIWLSRYPSDPESVSWVIRATAVRALP